MVTIPEGLIPAAYDVGQIVKNVKIKPIRNKNGVFVWVVFCCKSVLSCSGSWLVRELESDDDMEDCRFRTLQEAYDALIKYRDSLISNG